MTYYEALRTLAPADPGQYSDMLKLEVDRAAVRWCSEAFGAVTALDGCTFDARPGRLTGFLGPNGAGKTTAMRAVFGLVGLDSGLVTWRGAPIVAADRSRFGYMPEERGLYPRMRVREELLYLGELCGRSAAEVGRVADQWLEQLGVAARADARAAAPNCPPIGRRRDQFGGAAPAELAEVQQLLSHPIAGYRPQFFRHVSEPQRSAATMGAPRQVSQTGSASPTRHGAVAVVFPAPLGPRNPVSRPGGTAASVQGSQRPESFTAPSNTGTFHLQFRRVSACTGPDQQGPRSRALRRKSPRPDQVAAQPRAVPTVCLGVPSAIAGWAGRWWSRALGLQYSALPSERWGGE